MPMPATTSRMDGAILSRLRRDGDGRQHGQHEQQRLHGRRHGVSPA